MRLYMIIIFILVTLGGIVLALNPRIAESSETWVATAYCSCVKCCNKSDGITASGVKAHPGTVACNWLPFGAKMIIEGNVCTVEDRGAKSIFGDKNNHKKRVDIWFPSHKEALKFGRRNVQVDIIS